MYCAEWMKHVIDFCPGAQIMVIICLQQLTLTSAFCHFEISIPLLQLSLLYWLIHPLISSLLIVQYIVDCSSLLSAYSLSTSPKVLKLLLSYSPLFPHQFLNQSFLDIFFRYVFHLITFICYIGFVFLFLCVVYCWNISVQITLYCRHFPVLARTEWLNIWYFCSFYSSGSSLWCLNDKLGVIWICSWHILYIYFYRTYPIQWFWTTHNIEIIGGTYSIISPCLWTIPDLIPSIHFLQYSWGASFILKRTLPLISVCCRICFINSLYHQGPYELWPPHYGYTRIPLSISLACINHPHSIVMMISLKFEEEVTDCVTQICIIIWTPWLHIHLWLDLIKLFHAYFHSNSGIIFCSPTLSYIYTLTWDFLSVWFLLLMSSSVRAVWLFHTCSCLHHLILTCQEILLWFKSDLCKVHWHLAILRLIFKVQLLIIESEIKVTIPVYWERCMILISIIREKQ